MKRTLVLIGAVFALTGAFATGGLSPSLALRAGYAGAVSFGLEASWNCQLYQPPVGALRPALNLGMTGGGLSAAFAMRYLMDAPGGEGLRLGGGAGLGYQNGGFGLVRLDAEFDLPLSGLPAPAFVGMDAGYAFALTKGAFAGPFASFKAGLRF